MPLTVGVPRETVPGERRVAIVPEVAKRLASMDMEVRVEKGAGALAYYFDEAYEEAGARVVSGEEAWHSQVVLKVQAPQKEELDRLQEGSALIGFLRPFDAIDTVAELAKRKITALAMELVPRITRAQPMDALSAMSTVAGYKAALLAADRLPRFFPLLTTAAGTIRPARVFVIGAGVAGLQAIATARRLGAVVSAYDVRPAAKEQVLSVGAKFVELGLEREELEEKTGYARALTEEEQQKQRELLLPHIAGADVVITTALIAGRQAPLLILEEAVKQMRPGSVIVDLAAPNGGNCALTVPGETVERYHVTIMGPLNLPAELPVDASQMYARTLLATLQNLVKEGELKIDFDDEIFRSMCVTYNGEVVNERIRQMLASTDR